MTAPVTGGMESSPMEATIERLSQKPMASLGAVMAGQAAAPEGTVLGAAGETAEVQTETQPETSVNAVMDGLNNPEPQADGEPIAAIPESPEVGELSIDDGELVLRAERNADGTYKNKIDPTAKHDFEIRNKETGEVIKYSKTIPDLVRLAKDGIATQKYQTEVKQAHDELTHYRTKVPEWQQSFDRLQQDAEGYKALAMELLTSPEHQVVERREAYAAQNTPERQLARERAALVAEQNRLAAERQNWQFTQSLSSVTSRIAPAVQQVESLVGQDAAAGKLARESARLMVNGRIPPERFADLIAYVEGPYLQWAQGEAAVRSGVTAEAAKLAEAARVAQANAQKVVNTTGRANLPVGNGQTGNGPRTAPKDVNDAIERISLGRARRSA